MDKLKKEIVNTNDKNVLKKDWTKIWSSKYKVLGVYKEEVDVEKYSKEIRKLLNSLSKEYGYNELDSMLVLKDILAHEYLDNIRR